MLRKHWLRFFRTRLLTMMVLIFTILDRLLSNLHSSLVMLVQRVLQFFTTLFPFADSYLLLCLIRRTILSQTIASADKAIAIGFESIRFHLLGTRNVPRGNLLVSFFELFFYDIFLHSLTKIVYVLSIWKLGRLSLSSLLETLPLFWLCHSLFFKLRLIHLFVWNRRINIILILFILISFIWYLALLHDIELKLGLLVHSFS